MATKAEIVITARNKTKAAFRGVEGGLKKVRSAVNSTKLAMGALAGVAGLGLMINKSRKVIDSLGKMSDRLNISVVDLQALQLQAELSGSSTEAASKALEKMVRNLGDVARGTGEAKLSLEAMNVDVERLLKLDAGEQYREIAEAISGLGTQAEKASAAAAIFGRAGVQMINMIEGGSEAFDAAKKDIEEMGTALTRLDVSKVEAANDAITRAQTAFAGIFQNITVELAPFIEAISNMFVDLMKQNNGFRDVIIDNVEDIVLATAKVSDVFRGLEVVWKVLEVAFRGFVAGVLTQFELLDKAQSAIIDAIPFLDKKPSSELAQWAENSRIALARATDELHNLAIEPLPSQNVKAFFDNLRLEADKAAAKIAEMASVKTLLPEAKTDEQQAIEKKAADALERVRMSTISEVQILAEGHLQKQADLTAAQELGIASIIPYDELRSNLAQQFEDKITAITIKGLTDRQKFEVMSAKDKTKNVLGEMINMTQGVAQHSKTMFKINKTASLANALVSGYESFNKTMAAYPYPWNIGLAALGAVATGAQISAIQSTSFSGGGSGTTPSAAGSVPTINDIPITSPVDTIQPAGQIVNVTITGGLHDSNAVRELIESINEETGDGVQLNVTVAA